MIQDKTILIFSSEFPPLPGGIGNHALNLANQLSLNGYEVTVLTDQRSNAIFEDVRFDSKLAFKVHRTKREKVNFLTYINRIGKGFQLVTSKNEYVIASGKFSLWLCALFSVFFKKKNYIAILHGSEIRAGGSISKLVTNWSLKQFDKIISVSNFTKETALKYNPNLKIEVVNNGFVVPKANETTFRNNFSKNPKIVTVGNVSYRKGQHNVIHVLPMLKAHFPTIVYHCIGIPTEKASFLALAKKLNVQDCIIFHGALSNDEMLAVLNDADVFFMLSDVLDNGDFEGFGIAILEANSFGIPAIGSNNSGIVDAIKVGYSGELVDPKNSTDIVASFLKIMTNYDVYSKNAIQWSTNFSWDIIGRKYIEIIER